MTRFEWFLVVLVLLAITGIIAQAIHIITLRIRLEEQVDENDRLINLIDDSLTRPAASANKSKDTQFVEGWQYDEAVNAIRRNKR